MSESLGKFVIDLEARIDKLESDLGRAERIAAKQAQAMRKSFDESFKAIQEGAHKGAEGIFDAFQSLTGIGAGQLGIAALVGGLGEITKKAIETGDQLEKMAQKTGISVSSLSGLALAADSADVPLDALGASLAKFAKTQAMAATGGKEQAAAFAAMGVSIKNADGTLRPMEAVLGDVANKFAGYRDGTEKAALAQELFGKSGAQLIPLLNQGAEGLAKAAAEAKAIGYDFSETAKNSEKFNDNLKTLGAAAVGLGNDIAKELLPMLISAEEHVLSFIKSARENGTLQSFAHGVGVVAENLDKIAVVIGARLAFSALAAGANLAAGAFTALAGATTLAAGSFQLFGGKLLSVKTGLAVVSAAAAGWEFGSYLRENFLEAQLAGIALVDGLLTAWERLKGGAQTVFSYIDTFASNAKIRTQELEVYIGRLQGALSGQLADQLIAQLEKGIKKYGDGAAETKAKTDAAVASIHKLTGEMADDAIAAFNAAKNHKAAADAAKEHGDKAGQAAPNVVGLGKAAEEAAKKARLVAQDMLAATQFLDSLSAKMGGPYEQAVAKYTAALDQVDKMAAKFAVDGMKAADVQKFIADATRLATERLRDETDAQTAINRVLDDVNKKYSDEARLLGLTGRAREIEVEYQKLQSQADKELLATMGPLTDAQQRQLDNLKLMAARQVDLRNTSKLSEDTAKEWTSIWTNAASSIGDQFAKILVEGGSLFDGLKSIAKQTVEAIISYFAKLAVINPILNAIFGGGAGFSLLPTLANASGVLGGGAAGGAGGFNLSSPSTWLQAGKTLWSGFSSGFSSLWGGSATNPASANFMGPPVAGQAFGPQYGGYASGFQQALGVAGGIYAGYNRFQQAGGGVAGVAGGLAYGAGTYALGAGVSSMMAGTGFAAGVSGAFAAIPVVGWIAIAAMLIDKFSGGKLFGTGYQTKSSTQTINIGAGGGTATESLYQEGQKALFGGTKRRTKTVDPGADAQKAAADFYDSIKKEMTDAAGVMGSEVAPVIAAGISTVTEYDKKGHATATKYLVDVIGRQWTETSADLAAMRVGAEAMIAQVDVSAHGQASKIAEQWRSDAKLLADGAQFLLGAQVDINKQHALWKGADLTATTAEVQKLAQQNETLTQTYVRLQQQTQFMRSMLDGMNVALNVTGAGFVEFVDKLASAAGGLQNLQSEWSAYYQAYYSDAERAQNNLGALGKASSDALAAIGEDANVTMQKFRSDFEAYLKGSPTAEDTQKWLIAANALAQFTSATQQMSDAATAAAQQMANAQAQAIAQGVQAFQQLQTEAADLAAKLFGTSIEQLQSKLADLQANPAPAGDTIASLIYKDQVASLKRQISDAQAQQKKQQDFANASALLTDFAKIGAISGKSLEQLAQRDSVPLDKFASMLGMSGQELLDSFNKQVETARAAVETAGNTKYTNELLADILAVVNGQDLPFSPDQLAADAVNAPVVQSAAPGGKTVPVGASGPHADSVAPPPVSVQPVVDATNAQTRDLSEILRDLLAELRRATAGGGLSIVPRNMRGMNMRT